MFLAEQQAPEKGISVLQKLSKGIKEYNHDCCLDYATVQETLGTIYLMTANLPQAKTHFKTVFKIYEKIWADDPEMIDAKYQEIQELYPQVGFFLGQQISTFLTQQHCCLYQYDRYLLDYKDDDKDDHSLTEKWKSLIPMLTALCTWREKLRE